MKSDVVIIGGGVSGLAAGALLAKAGRRVTVLEQGNQPGGRAYTYEDKGFTLNYGPHAIYRPHTGMLPNLFARLGVPAPSFGIVDPARAYWSDNGRFGPVGARPQDVLLTSLFPLATRAKLVPLMAAIRFAKPTEFADETYGNWVERHTADPRLRRFALALATVSTYTRPAAALSAAFVVGHMQRNMFAKDAVGYMSGGWRSMYERFIDVLEAHGGALVTGARVEQVQTEGESVTAVVASGFRYEADDVVCTLPPQDAPSIASPGSPLRAELERHAAVEDVRALCMDLGFNRRIRDDVTYVFDIGSDLYYSAHSEVTPDLAPAGSMLLHAMAYLSPEEAGDERLLAGRREALVAGLDRWFEGWRDALVVERTLPNVRVCALRQTPAQRLNRMPLRAASARNLYFAGDARDVEGNLTEICLETAIEVADALAAPRETHRAPAITVA